MSMDIEYYLFDGSDGESFYFPKEKMQQVKERVLSKTRTDMLDWSCDGCRWCVTETYRLKVNVRNDMVKMI